ncbi:hypothetical protein [Roseivirga pacifica]|uniref:hypothetical protein n=1 Tax=Roseivirga pacifica TaxID=1267423 RepID=UPI003BB00E13
MFRIVELRAPIIWSVRLACSLLLLLCSAVMLRAQNGIQTDSLVLSPALKTMVEADDKSAYPPEYEQFFNIVQQNALGADGKQEMLELTQILTEKRFTPRYDFKPLLQLLTTAKEEKNFGTTQQVELLGLVKTLSAEKDKAGIQALFAQLQRFLAEDIFYQDRFVTVLFKNADFELKNNKAPESTGNEVWEASEAAPADANAQSQDNNPLTAPMPPMFEEFGPIMHIKKGDLYLANYYDTFAIRGIEAYYFFEQNRFSAQDGRVTWENVGVDANKRFARLRTYEFEPGQLQYTFENVLFMDTDKLSEPIQGELSLDFSVSRTELKTFPRFLSYYANNEINQVQSDKIRFVGGIYFQGNNFYSESKFKEPSTVYGTINGERKFRARGKHFEFNHKDSLLSSDRTELTLYHNGDSIVHPAVELKYNFKTDYLEAETKVKGFKTTPFRSSYYNMDMIGDEVQWDLNADSLNLMVNSARADVPLIIESKDFFSATRFNDMAEVFGFHPLIIANSMAEKYGDTFYVGQLLSDYQIQEALLKRSMEVLMANGMVKYDAELGEITLLEKGKHFKEASALSEAYDYDDLLIPSIIASAPNATISFKDSVMTVRGVEQFLVSDSLEVVITPTDGEIKLLKNRDIEFDGSLDAGNFQFNGTKFKFSYDSFLVNLANIDSIKLAVELSEGEREALSNQLVNTSGVLRINEIDNKSALRSIPQYPIFSSSESASVQFDKNTVLKGAYDSTIYFDVPPFELDSVADADPTKYAFQGTLYTNGILPDFKEDLRVMEDNSLGFVHAIPDSGYNLYKTGGRLFGELKLDNNGITTPGHIEYLSGNFLTENATLFLDSMVSEKGISASLEAATIDSTSFPSMNIEEYSMNWLAKSDSMLLENLNEARPFRIFDDQADLRGQLILRTSGLFGKGEMLMEGSTVLSDSIAFSTNSFESRNTTFTLKTEDSSKPILSSEDVRINYDLVAQKATVEPEVAGAAALEFPFAEFKTSIPSAEWDIQAKKIVMTKPEETPLEQSFFYSTNKVLDSLAFNATDAVYDINSKELTVKGIPHIQVADARITPQGDSLTILENSQIGTLTNAVIVLDSGNNYHRMFDAEIEILSRKRFRGKATYELINALQDTFAIQFDEFQFIESEKDKKPYTKASGTVAGSQGVKVSSGFIFEGKITMYAYRKALELDGAVKLDLASLSERNIWIEYKSDDDISEVIIPFDEALTKQGQPLNAGLHFDDKGEIYMSFITEKRNHFDDDFFVPKGGNLYFHTADSSYRIDNPNKLEDPSTYFAGSMFTYQEATQEVSFEGKLNFIGGPQGGNVQAAGKGTGNLDSATLKVNSMFALSFGLPVEGLAAMGQDLAKMGEELGVAKALDDRSELIYRVSEFIGDEATRKWDKSFQTVPAALPNVSQGQELLRDIVITDVELHWSKQNRAFYSKGKIGVSNVSNINLNMELDGFVEIRKTPDGDVFTVLLEMTDGTWYYFNYDGFVMGSFSSNDAYNATIMNANSGKNKVGSFRPFMNTQPEVMQWVMDFRKLYYGIDEPYRLLMASESNQTLKKKDTIEGDGF